MDSLVILLKTDPNAANAFGALASAAAAFLALLLSAIAIAISIWGVRRERQHSQLAVRPLAEVTVADYEDCLRVKLRNNGIGPMLVKAVTISDGKDAKSSLLDWMPELPSDRPWNTFAGNVDGRSLAPSAEIVLLELKEHDGERGFFVLRDSVRAALAPLTVNVEYTNIYDVVMRPVRRPLAWFGRNIVVNSTSEQRSAG